VDGNYFGMGQNSVAMNINEKGVQTKPHDILLYRKINGINFKDIKRNLG